MAGSITENAAIYTKQTYKYVPPKSPSALIEGTSFTLDFADRKFIQVGIDPSNNFNVMIHIITQSRHVAVSPEFLQRLFSIMGGILSFVLDISDGHKKKQIFLNTETEVVSSMVYRGENNLVIESKSQEGCRIVLNARNLISLQNLEWCIFENFTRKSTFVRPTVLYQFNKLSDHIELSFNSQKFVSVKDMVTYIRSLSNDSITEFISKSEQSFVSQLQILAVEQLATRLVKNLSGEDSFKIKVCKIY